MCCNTSCSCGLTLVCEILCTVIVLLATACVDCCLSPEMSVFSRMSLEDNPFEDQEEEEEGEDFIDTGVGVSCVVCPVHGWGG